ncbi:DUF4760 domain-containing protein [Micromonospora hortensis]|uniref:DUF4760 domain-containing protein n=1 Tax=Micromonospora hortensis TaxID=2911209 RepID=UPI0035566F16
MGQVGETSLANAASLLFSLLALALSAVFALRQSKIMRDSNLVPVLTDLFKEFRDPSFKEHMSYIQFSLWGECPPSETGMTGLTPEARSHVAPVMGLFTTVGLLVAHGVIDELIPASSMGGSVLRSWARLSPYIYEERERRNDPHYGVFFENLAYRALRNPPARLKRRMRLKRMPRQWFFAGWEGLPPEEVAALFAPPPVGASQPPTAKPDAAPPSQRTPGYLSDVGGPQDAEGSTDESDTRRANHADQDPRRGHG